MNNDQLLAFAPIAAIAGTAVAVMLAIAVRRNFFWANVIAAAGLILTLSLLLPAWHVSPVQATLLVRMDDYGLFFIGLLILAGLAVLALCYDYFKHRSGENEELILLLLTGLTGAAVLISSNHFASFFLGLEILSVSLFVLIGYSLDRPQPLEASIKYLVLSGVSSASLLLGMALIYAQSGTLASEALGRFIAESERTNPMLLGGFALIMAGIGFKLSLTPFHLWTPDVYEGAPAPITAFIATVSKAAVFAWLLRFFLATDITQAPELVNIVSFVAVLSILAGNLLALLQNNVKRLLAYSSIAHMGYLLIALLAAGKITQSLAVETVIFYLVAYFVTTIGAFGIVSLLSTPQHEAADLSHYRGLFWRRPWLASSFTLMLLSLAGIPLTAGFIGKFYIFTSGADGRLWGLLGALIVGSGLGLYYYLRVIVTLTMKHETGENPESAGLSGGGVSSATLALLTVLVVWFGVYPDRLINLIESVAQTMQ